MNKHLEQLINLSIIDKEIDAFKPQIDEVNERYDKVVATQNAIDAEIEQLGNEIQEELVKKQKNELHLEELSLKLEENKKKSADIKSEREMKSLQLEEEIAKEQVTFANEEIARLEKLIEVKEEQITALKEKKAEVEEGFAAIKEEVDQKLSELNTERQKVYEKKEELVAKMNQKGLSFYQKIRRWAKNTTAVPVREQACMGCFMRISDKIYSDVIKGEEITTCPHCGRLLYIEEQEAAEA